MRKINSILVIDDEAELNDLVREELQKICPRVDCAFSAEDAKKKILAHDYDIVVSDVYLPGQNGVALLAELKRVKSRLPRFIFMSGYADANSAEQANRLGATDFLNKPFSGKELLAAVERTRQGASDYITDIMYAIQAISGLKLGTDKRQLVESRIYRRAKELGLNDLKGYEAYFREHRHTEIDHLMSHLTTHHTFFFREGDHFNYLFDTLFPEALRLKKSIRIWSAACSSGEEPYSIAMCYLEFLRTKGLTPADAPSLEVHASDIDHAIVHKARQGIYPVRALASLRPELVQRYFDLGRGELQGYARVKNEVHRLCQFSRRNLLDTSQVPGTFDAIFVRNVLIYFAPETIERIVKQLARSLGDEGCLILGHSESLMGLKTDYLPLRNSIYRLKGAFTANPTPLTSSLTKHEKLVRVFVIDDSPTVRAILKRVITGDPRLEFVGEAENPVDGGSKLNIAKPDVVALDIHMPKMDGISYLRSLAGKDHPPVVMISSVSKQDADSAMHCFELGASAYIEKPNGQDLAAKSSEIVETLLASARSKFRGSTEPKKHAPGASCAVYRTTDVQKDLIVIGASTGGVEAIKNVMTTFPPHTPPILIVQHIPPVFSCAFASRLSGLCKIRVKEAEDGEIAEENTAYVAPGGFQMGVQRSGNQLRIRITDDARVNRHKPSVDYLFEAVVKHAHDFHIAAALLTGMGADGAKGLLSLKGIGAHTITQDEDSCVVYGMPKVANELGAATECLPLTSISYHLFRALSDQHKKRKAA